MMDKMMGSMTDKEQATTTQADKMHAREAWFEHGTARIYYEVMGHGDPVLLLLG